MNIEEHVESLERMIHQFQLERNQITIQLSEMTAKIGQMEQKLNKLEQEKIQAPPQPIIDATIDPLLNFEMKTRLDVNVEDTQWLMRIIKGMGYYRSISDLDSIRKNDQLRERQRNELKREQQKKT